MEYKPYRNELYKFRMLQRLKTNKSFRNIFRYDLTELFNDYLNSVVNNPNFMTNTIISIYGETGSGKSLCGFTLGKNNFQNFSDRNMFFYDQEILDNAQHFNRNTLIIRDENPRDAMFGIGSNRIRTQFSLLAEVCRKYGLNLFLIEPTLTISEISKFYLETIDMDIKRRITRVGLIDPKTMEFLGAVYIKVVPESDKDWIAYNDRKDSFIDSIRLSDYSGGKANYDNIIDKIIDTGDLFGCKTKSERISVITMHNPNLTTSEVKMLSDLITIRERKDNNEED